MSESIIVGTDGSETAVRALEEAIRIDKALGCDIHVVSAYKPLVGAKVVGGSGAGSDVAKPLPDALVTSTLEQAAASVRTRGVKVETHALAMEPAEAVLKVAGDVAATLIVVGSAGMHGAKRVLGSVPNTITHHAGCNVLIVATDQP
jgi:nucleotide-binding universal stress UspA family protein